MQQVAVIGVFCITFCLILFRPRGINEGVAGAVGAILIGATSGH
ncbi:MAG: hypothetical protein PHV61_04195 [Limnochordia bacterium]|nr:hypothetical protein [Limnochordia bacterium]